MELFRKKSPPDIDKLRAKKDVKGLIKALWWGWRDPEKENGIDALYRKKAALSLAEIANVKAIESLVEVIRKAEFFKDPKHSKVSKELFFICQLAKESLSHIGEPAVEQILRFIQKYRMDLLADINKFPGPELDSAQKSMLEVLINIGDDKTIMKNLLQVKGNVLPKTFLSVYKRWLSEISASDDRLVNLASMAAQAAKTNDNDLFNTIRSVLITHVDIERFANVVRTRLPMSEQVEILNTLCKRDATTDNEGVKDMNKRCAHCESAFYMPKTMKDKIDFNAMQKVRVGCSKCGTAVCFSCAATAADQRGKEGNCFCPKCGAELGREGEAGKLGEHYSGWN